MYSGYASIFEPSIHLRDDSHATSAGAVLYGELLADFVCKILTEMESSCMPFDSRRERVHDSISHLKPNVGFLMVSENYRICKSLHFLVRPHESRTKVRFVVDNIIGPFSPVILLQVGPVCYQSSLWDPWCHFERECFSSLPVAMVDCDAWNVCSILISNILPNYAKCRKQDFMPPAVEDICFKIRSIYCIGGDIVPAAES